MLKRFLFTGAKTDDEYREKLYGRRIRSVMTALLGVMSIVAGIAIGQGETFRADFLSGVYCGVGGSVLFASVVGIIKTSRLLRDTVKLRRERIKEGDERNEQIAGKAYKTAGFIFLYVCMAVLLAAGFLSMEVFWTIWCVIMGYSIIVFLLLLYYKRKN